ncbi:MAG: NADP-dependent malic enzyme, partial [Acidisphaera sp.]|nr:NADP-dependent malic enzyme [Acidisphaera sp.]
LSDVKIVASGAGAAAIATLNLLVSMGAQRKNIWVCDIDGLVHEGRNTTMDRWKAFYAQKTDKRTLGDVIGGADIFIGLSAPGVLKPEMAQAMGEKPLIMALANPTPEIMPEEARKVRPDAMICTGRSDYPNQVNNVLCFPFIFRGALDVGATTINEEMKLAATRAIAALAEAEQSDVVASAYGVHDRFGPEHLIPRPFDPRLISTVAPAVAEAAMKSGVATQPIEDMKAYRDQLERHVYRSGAVMQPVFAAATTATHRLVYAEGEDERVLRAVQIVVDEKLAQPIVVGRPEVIGEMVRDLGLRITPDRDFEVVSVDGSAAIGDAAEQYYLLGRRSGVTRAQAELQTRRDPTLLGAMLVRQGRADGLLCGLSGGYGEHLRLLRSVIGLRPGVATLAAMNLLMLPEQMVFVCDTQINQEPSAEQLVDIAMLAAEEVRRFGQMPRVALLSHSSFGSEETPSAVKMRHAAELLAQRAPEMEVEGELQGDAALSIQVLERVFPGSRLTGVANLLVMPNLDAANITFSCLRVVSSQGVTVGPILLGAAKPVHILMPTTTVRGLVNMTALTAVEAGVQE